MSKVHWYACYASLAASLMLASCTWNAGKDADFVTHDVPLLASPADCEGLTCDFSNPPLSSFDLALTCGIAEARDPSRLSHEEGQALIAFAEFLQDHQDQVVHVGVRIEQACAACGCPRAEIVADASDDGSDASDEPFTGTLTIDVGDAQTRGEGFAGHGWGGARMFLEGILLDANVPGWAVTHMIFLPRWWHLDNGQYHAGEYGDFARFDGLFVARFHGRTGVNMLHLDPINPTSQQLAQLEALRSRRHEENSRREVE